MEQVIRFEGLSLRCLSGILSDILQGQCVQGVELWTLNTDGSTVQVVGDDGTGEWVSITLPHNREHTSMVKRECLTRKARSHWTVEDVREYVVMAQTRKRKCFFLDCVDPVMVGRRFQGAFVSQARKSSFKGLVQALEYHYREQDPDDVFVWMDLFSANQPLLTQQHSDDISRERASLLNSGLHEVIRNFDELLIFFNSWDEPYPLQRAWCVWEIYGATVAGKPLDIIFDPSAGQDVLSKLKQDHNVLLVAISRLDPRKMECHSKSDLEMIRRVVEELPGGFSELKIKVTERLRTWLLDTVQKSIQEEEASKGSRETQQEEIEFGRLLHHAGLFMIDMGENALALKYLFHAREILEGAYETYDHSDVAKVLGGIGVALFKETSYEKALEIHEKALGIKLKILGLDHPSTAETYHDIGEVFRMQGKDGRALEMYETALRVNEELFGECHLQVATCCNSIAMILKQQGKYSLALKMYQRALVTQMEVLGERHPSTATTEFNIGVLLEDQGKIEMARPRFVLAVGVFEETLGSDHRCTQIAKSHLLQNQHHFTRKMTSSTG